MNNVLEFISHLNDTAGFSPRWLCGSGWQPLTGWFMIGSDLLIFSAYMAIPLLLIYFVKQKKNILYSGIFFLFATFIFSCGVSHLLDALMFWWPAYRLSAFERFLTGTISWVTVFALIPLIPKALTLPTPAILQQEVNERERVEQALHQLNSDLERIVEERTHELNKKAWQLETANQELQTFSYSVSHDLKAPLRKIRQFSERIQNENVDNNLKSYLHRIEVNAKHMSQLIEDLLSFSNIANSDLGFEEVNLSAMAVDICRDLQEQEPQRSLQCQIQEGLVATGDATLLQTVLQNLFSNAWKYSAHNELTRIEFGSTQSNGRDCYYIKDNGIGFDMSASGRLFQPFQRLHSKKEFEGTGIGLANVRRIISRHGGQIWVESQPNQGTIFYFTLGEISREAIPKGLFSETS